MAVRATDAAAGGRPGRAGVLPDEGAGVRLEAAALRRYKAHPFLGGSLRGLARNHLSPPFFYNCEKHVVLALNDLQLLPS